MERRTLLKRAESLAFSKEQFLVPHQLTPTPLLQTLSHQDPLLLLQEANTLFTLENNTFHQFNQQHPYLAEMRKKVEINVPLHEIQAEKLQFSPLKLKIKTDEQLKLLFSKNTQLL